MDVSGDLRVVNMSNLFLIESCCSGAYFENRRKEDGSSMVLFCYTPTSPRILKC